MRKARRDVPSYRSWVFPLQTSVKMMEGESVPATFSSPSPPSFLPLTGLGAFAPLFFFFSGCECVQQKQALTGDSVCLFSHTPHIPPCRTFSIFVLESKRGQTFTGFARFCRDKAAPARRSSQCVLLPSSVSTLPTWQRLHHAPM